MLLGTRRVLWLYVSKYKRLSMTIWYCYSRARLETPTEKKEIEKKEQKSLVDAAPSENRKHESQD